LIVDLAHFEFGRARKSRDKDRNPGGGDGRIDAAAAM
jgi:hypothetical protein